MATFYAGQADYIAKLEGLVTGATLLAGTNMLRYEHTGGAAPAGSAGVGGELFVTGGTAYVQSFNRTSAAYAPMGFNASQFVFGGGGYVGMGVTPAASCPLDILVAVNAVRTVQFTNSDTGTASAAGLNLVAGAKSASFYTRAPGHSAPEWGLYSDLVSSPFIIYNNGVAYMRLSAAGDFTAAEGKYIGVRRASDNATVCAFVATVSGGNTAAVWEIAGGGSPTGSITLGGTSLVQLVGSRVGVMVSPNTAATFEVKMATNVHLAFSTNVDAPAGSASFCAWNDAVNANIGMELRASAFYFSGTISGLSAALRNDGFFLYNISGPGSIADTVCFYSSDDAAGHTIPSFQCEGTNVVATGQADSVSSVRVKMRINGTVRTFLCI